MSAGFLNEVRDWLASFDPSPRKALLLAFLFGFVVRMIPELLSFPHPIGFDTIYYGWKLKEGVVWTHWSGAFSSWLFYGLAIPLYRVLGGNPFLMLKVVMPLLFGLNICGVYYLATRGLKWSTRKGLFAAGLFSFQAAALGISWNFYRNMLGLGILLFAVALLFRERFGLRNVAAVGALSLLVVLSHEYAAVLLMLAVLAVLSSRIAWRSGKALKVLVAVLPAVLVFLASVWLRVYPMHRVVESNVLRAFEQEGHYSGPLFLFTNYLAVLDTFQHYSGYLDLLVSVVSLFILLYVAVVPLSLVGFFRQRVLDWWLAFICVGAFGCLVVPVFALDYWSRWMLMLVFPMTFYATNGFVRVLKSARPVSFSLRWLRSFGVSRRLGKGLLLASVLGGFVFMTSPTFLGKGGVFFLPHTVVYVPSTMQCNSVPLCDVDAVVGAFKWVETAMDSNSCFLAHDAFYYWAQFSFDSEHYMVFFKGDVQRAVDMAAQQGLRHIWLVWWGEDIGWYGFSIPESFAEVVSFGRISVFEYRF